MSLKPKTSARARRLRQDATDAENRLWQVLRSRQLAGYKFRRQHPINRYITDFACVEHHLIVEVNGGQHNGSIQDEIRTGLLNKEGWYILRFWNDEILTNADGVAAVILAFMQNHHLTPSSIA